jgi:disulfide oxidoreductase YuzD
LTDTLQDVDARQHGQPGGIDLAGDFRVAALIKIGDPAVPALLDVLEKDERLTRSVHFWRDFTQSRTVLSVREAALTALMSILRVRVFNPRSTGDNFTSRGDEAAKEATQKLRAYWKEFGSLAFDERMMKVLKDPNSRFEALREAAGNLADGGAERILGTTVWSNTLKERPKGPNPAVKRFNNPTAAETILSAMDRDLANHDAKEKDFLHDYRRRILEDQYLFPLIALGDKRSAAELAKRAGAADSIRMRRKWAYASFHLGDPEPMKKYADDFSTGKIELPANDRPQTNEFDQPGYVELRDTVRHLGGVSLPEVDRALDTLADRKNPAHAQVAKAILANSYRFEEQGWTDHPYCLKILRDALDDEKTRDQAGQKLLKLVIGLSPNASREEMKTMLDRFQGKFRRSTKVVWQAEDAWGNPRFEPDIVPLDRPATVEDVKAGRAVFHLSGKGKRTDLALPAFGIPNTDSGRVNPLPILIVQAKTGPEGSVIYGILSRHAIRSAPATDFNRVTPLKEFKEGEQ